jgi:hypothetical protein
MPVQRFVIGTANLTKDQESKFIAFLGEMGAGWWHWLPNFWLVKSLNGKVNVENIRDAISDISNADCLVMQIEEDITWATFGGVQKNGKKMTNWLKESWGKDD